MSRTDFEPHIVGLDETVDRLIPKPGFLSPVTGEAMATGLHESLIVLDGVLNTTAKQMYASWGLNRKRLPIQAKDIPIVTYGPRDNPSEGSYDPQTRTPTLFADKFADRLDRPLGLRTATDSFFLLSSVAFEEAFLHGGVEVVEPREDIQNAFLNFLRDTSGNVVLKYASGQMTLPEETRLHMYGLVPIFDDGSQWYMRVSMADEMLIKVLNLEATQQMVSRVHPGVRAEQIELDFLRVAGIGWGEIRNFAPIRDMLHSNPGIVPYYFQGGIMEHTFDRLSSAQDKNKFIETVIRGDGLQLSGILRKTW